MQGRVGLVEKKLVKMSEVILGLIPLIRPMLPLVYMIGFTAMQK